MDKRSVVRRHRSISTHLLYCRCPNFPCSPPQRYNGEAQTIRRYSRPPPSHSGVRNYYQPHTSPIRSTSFFNALKCTKCKVGDVWIEQWNIGGKRHTDLPKPKLDKAKFPFHQNHVEITKRGCGLASTSSCLHITFALFNHINRTSDELAQSLAT